MEIYYCEQCHTRVSSVDVEQGAGIIQAGKTYCRACGRSLGFIHKDGSHRDLPQAGSKRAVPRVGSHRDMDAAIIPRRDRPERPVADTCTKAIIVMVVVAVVLAAAGIMGWLAIRARENAPPTSANMEPTIVPTPGEEITPPPQSAVFTAPVAVFPSSAGWHSFLTDSWKLSWAPRGGWQFEGGLLTAALMSGSDLALESMLDWEDCDLGVTFQCQSAADVVVGFRIRGTGRGAVTIRNPAPGQWHSVALSLVGEDLKDVLVDGQAVTPGDVVAVDDATMDPVAGKLRFAFRATDAAAGRCAVGELALKRRPRATDAPVPAIPTRR
ncbi:MAG: hypothetical protein ABIF71_15745 [Planctomycetota bacterium]